MLPLPGFILALLHTLLLFQNCRSRELVSDFNYEDVNEGVLPEVNGSQSSASSTLENGVSAEVATCPDTVPPAPVPSSTLPTYSLDGCSGVKLYSCTVSGNSCVSNPTGLPCTYYGMGLCVPSGSSLCMDITDSVTCKITPGCSWSLGSKLPISAELHPTVSKTPNPKKATSSPAKPQRSPHYRRPASRRSPPRRSLPSPSSHSLHHR